MDLLGGPLELPRHGLVKELTARVGTYPSHSYRRSMMEERRDEVDEAIYQLMLDVQTGRLVDTPRRSRVWILVGCVTLVLGGLGGLLLASGNRSHDTAGSNQGLAPIFTTYTPPRPQEPHEGAPLIELLPVQEKNFPEKHRSLAQESPERPPAAAVQPPSGRKSGAKTKGLSASSADTPAPKSASRPPRVASKSKRGCDCTWKEWAQRASPQRQFRFSSRSLSHEFDPNGELVRSKP
jgi:hypothetical protein